MMNPKHIVIICVVLAGIVFGMAALLHKQSSSPVPNDLSASIASLQGGPFSNDPQTGASAETLAARPAEDFLIRFHSPIIGKIDAPVTIVEFLDPSCEACREFFPTVEEIIKRYPEQVRVVIRYVTFHEGSDQAVGILEAARKQNLFLPILTVLFERQPEWAVHGSPNLELAWTLAAGVGLDLEKGRIDAADPAVSVILQQDMSDVTANNVEGTPTFFINGIRLQEFGTDKLMVAVKTAISALK